jgi:hypothetical protein
VGNLTECDKICVSSSRYTMNPEAMTRLTYIIDAGSQFTKVAYLDKLSPPKASLRRSGHSEQFGNTRLVKSWPGGEKSSCPELLPTCVNCSM